MSDAGVVYATGDALVTANDLGLGVTRTYSAQEAFNQSAYTPNGNVLGNGWMLADQPYATENGSSVVVVLGQYQTYQFTDSNGSYAPEFGALETLADSGGMLVFAMPDGTVYQFFDFSYAGVKGGEFYSMTSPGGGGETATYTSAGQIATINYVASGNSHAYQTEQFTYYPGSAASAGLLESIELYSWSSASSFWSPTNLRQVTYTYYNSASKPDGGTGDLESATEQYWSGTGWTGGDTYYYRYYTGSGMANGLELALTPQGVLNAEAACKVSTVTGLTDSQLQPYASNYFIYGASNGSERVTNATVGGLYPYSYSYAVNADTVSPASPQYNVWQTETIEGMPDSSTDVVFTNFAGEVMLTDLSDQSSSPVDTSRNEHWVTYNEYGKTGGEEEGLMTETAEPSAIEMISSGGQTAGGQVEFGYNSNDEDLGVDLNPTAGLIDEYFYGDTVGASGISITGNIPTGYLQSEWLFHGADDTNPMPVATYTYVAQAGTVDLPGGASAAVTMYPLASESTYPSYVNGTNTGAVDTTSYSYKWWSNPDGSASDQEQSVATLLPIVGAAQNGPGTQWTEEDFYDPSGNLTWQKDADGYLTLNQYDATTGLLMESVQNVNTGSLPSPIADAMDPTVSVPVDPLAGGILSTPVGDTTNLNATTDYTYDGLGRVTQVEGPAFTANNGATVRSVQWTDYLDSVHEVRTASGTLTSTTPGGTSITPFYTLYNPISVTRYDSDGDVTDQIQVTVDATPTTDPRVDPTSRAPVTISGEELSNFDNNPLPTPNFTSSYTSNPYSSWTENHYDAADQLLKQDVYTNISDSGGAYNETSYAYDLIGRLTGTTDPTGTTTTDVYDARGLLTAVFAQAGINNTGQLLDEYVYDNGAGGGDGPPTQSTEYVDDNAADNRTTDYGYDWRDRQLWTLVDDGAGGSAGRETYTYNTYDNVDNVTDVTRYYDPSDVLPNKGPNAGDEIIGEAGSAYDALGQVYETTSYDPSGTNPIHSYTWYDGDGNAIATAGGGTGEFTKTTYDAAWATPWLCTTATTPEGRRCRGRPAPMRGPPAPSATRSWSRPTRCTTPPATWSSPPIGSGFATPVRRSPGR